MTKQVRIIGNPDNQRPDNWSYAVLLKQSLFNRAVCDRGVQLVVLRDPHFMKQLKKNQAISLFLISKFRLVLNVVQFLLGNSPAS
jgi:hypothetical protein